MTRESRRYNPRTDHHDRRRFLPNGKHPAKMYVALLLDIVRRYTKPGDTILDPCLGLGTTLCAMLLGRNVVGIELEAHHHRDATLNAERVASFARQLGKDSCYAVIHGDSTAVLPELFPGPQADGTVLSPAYADALTTGQEGWDAMTAFDGDVQKIKAARKAKGGGLMAHSGYGVDSVVMSSAYGEMNAEHAGGAITQRPNKDGVGFEGGKEGFVYGRDAVKPVAGTVFSPPYVQAHSDSPRDGGEPKEGIKESAGTRLMRRASNIYQPDTQVNGTVMSPAYEGALPDAGDPTKGVERIRRKVEAGELHTENPGNIGRRGRWGSGITNDRITTTGYGVDAAVMSGPYESVASRDRHLEPFATKDPERARALGQDSVSRNVSGYGKTVGQVGNMKLSDGSYQSAMTQIYAACLVATVPGGVLVTVTGNYIRDGQVVDLAAVTIDLCKIAGWVPVERWKALKRSKDGKPSVSFWRISQHKAGQELIDSEDVLVFRAPGGPDPVFTDLDPQT